jgi:hypothetical protein
VFALVALRATARDDPATHDSLEAAEDPSRESVARFLSVNLHYGGHEMDPPLFGDGTSCPRGKGCPALYASEEVSDCLIEVLEVEQLLV